MPDAKKLTEYAAECLRMAEHSLSEEKSRWETLAAKWQAMAEEESKKERNPRL